MALYKYTPGLADPEVLRKTIVGREEQLKTIARILKNASSRRSLSHALLIGPRGIGKTHLLRIIYHSVRGDIDLKPLGRYGDHFVPVIFPEEEYINSLEKFLARAVKYLGSESAPGTPPAPQSFNQPAGEVRREHLIAFFKDYKRKFSKKVLLLIDNADDIINGFSEEDQAAMRDLLMTSDSVLFIGAAPTLFDAVVDHERPLYNFFEPIWLKEISFGDMGVLLQKFAEIEKKRELLSKFQKSEAKLRAVHSLSGGNPRLILSLYQIMAEGDITGVEDTFIRLIDDFSPLFREKMKDLSRQQREIIDVMAQATQLLTPTEIAASCNTPVNVVNAQIKRLEKEGFVKKVETGRGKKAIYEIREKLFCLWRQMRVEAGRKRLGFIVNFYEIWYSKEDLEEQLNKITSDLTTVLSREEPAIQTYKDKLWYIAEALGKPEISARVEADLSYFKGDYEGSVKSLLKYLNVHKHDEEAWYNLGIAYGGLQKYEDAVSAYKKALEIKPDKHEAWNDLGVAYDDLQKYEEAISAYKEVLEIKPDKHEAWYNLANAFRHLQKHEDAISAYKKALEIKPDKHEAWNNLGNAYGDLQKYEDAVSAYKKALEIKPDQHEAWYNLGIAYGGLQKYEEAISAYKKALEIKPDKHEAWNNLGNAYGDLKKYEEAISAYKKVLEIKPDEHKAWYNLGNAFRRLQKFEDAIGAYKKALEIKPDKHEAWYNLGNAYGDLQKYEDAIEAYAKAIQINPEDPDVWMNLCAAHLGFFGEDTLAKGGEFDPMKLRQALECLPHIKEKKGIYEIFGSILRFLLEEKKLERIRGILTEIERIGHGDLLQFLTPYSTLLKYIDTKDPQVIERLRSEERTIVEEMLQTLEKGRPAENK